MIVEPCCPLILITTLLLVVKHSTTLNVVTGPELMVVWVSLTLDTTLLGFDTTTMFCWLCSTLGDWITGVADDVWSGKLWEDKDGKTTRVEPILV